MHKVFLAISLFTIGFSPLNVNAGWGDWVDVIKQTLDSESTSDALSETDVISGLKEALNKGSRLAVDQLGRVDGYYADPAVKIPMPQQLQDVESALRKLKQDKLADDFVLSMNRAAEQAVPKARDILVTIVQGMSVDDAWAILKGPDDAATSYLRQKGGPDLTQQFRPIVARTTDSVGVTRKYKSLLDNLGTMSRFVDTSSLDIDGYVTEKAVDGLFTLIAREEKTIRENPAARTTELLKKVFSTQ